MLSKRIPASVMPLSRMPADTNALRQIDALRESERQFRLLADNMSQLAWTADPEGCIQWYNERWYAYTGASLESMQALGWRAVHHQDHYQRVTARLKHCFATGSVWEDTFPLRSKDGNFNWFLCRALPIRDDQGHITHWLGTHTDITAQVNAEDALRELNDSLELRVAERTRELAEANRRLQVEMAERAQAEEALRHAQKMDAIGQLTGGIAHDFNNMLTGVLGALDLMRLRIAAGRVAEVDKYIDAATTAVNRAAALTQRLLTFARRQSLTTSNVAVNDMVESMEELLRRTIGESIVLHIELQEHDRVIRTDEHQLENALLNLVINARDAMPEGGCLRVSSQVTTIDSFDQDLAPGEYVQLSVEDSGCGIAPEVIDKVFDPFFTTKPVGQGTGLGLSMVYGFMKQTGGHVRVDSREGEGTAIRLYLPCVARVSQPMVDVSDARLTPRAVAGECVLVVEDESAVRMLVVDALRDLGYATLQSADAAGAITCLKGSGRIDLLISDVGLPGLNGHQLADIARQLRSGLKVLFMTGYAGTHQPGEQATAVEPDVLTKPFNVDELAARVRGMLDRREIRP